MSMEEIAKKLREQYPPDWNIFVDDEGILCVHSPRDLTPEMNKVLVEKWYEVTGAMPRPFEGTYHVTLDDISFFAHSSNAAAKNGLKLVPTDDPLRFQVLSVDDEKPGIVVSDEGDTE